MFNVLKHLKKRELLFLFFGFLIAYPQTLHAETKNKGVKKSGVVFNIAEDRRVEKIGGIMQPEPLDLYLKRLFDGLSGQITKIDDRLNNIEADMAKLKTDIQGIKSQKEDKDADTA